MARLLNSPTVAAKFEEAEFEVIECLDNVKETITILIATAATSTEPAEVRLQRVIMSLDIIKQMQNVRAQVGKSLKICKNEAVNVNAGFLKFAMLSVDPNILQATFGTNNSNRKRKRTNFEQVSVAKKSRLQGMFSRSRN